MFTLECMPKDTDLFFTIIDERNSALKSFITCQEHEYYTSIVCNVGFQNKIPTFRQTDIRDCVNSFSNLSKYLVYRITTKNPFFVMSQVAWLSEDLGLFITHGTDFVKDAPFNWKEQYYRSLTKLLLDATG